MKLVIVQLSPCSVYFLCLRSGYNRSSNRLQSNGVKYAVVPLTLYFSKPGRQLGDFVGQEPEPSSWNLYEHRITDDFFVLRSNFMQLFITHFKHDVHIHTFVHTLGYIQVYKSIHFHYMWSHSWGSCWFESRQGRDVCAEFSTMYHDYCLVSVGPPVIIHTSGLMACRVCGVCMQMNRVSVFTLGWKIAQVLKRIFSMWTARTSLVCTALGRNKFVLHCFGEEQICFALLWGRTSFFLHCFGVEQVWFALL